MRLKKSSSGIVGPRGGISGGGQRWSSILEDWADTDTQVGASHPQPLGPDPELRRRRDRSKQGPPSGGNAHLSLRAAWATLGLPGHQLQGQTWELGPQNGPHREPQGVTGPDTGLCRRPPRSAPKAPRSEWCSGVFSSRRDRVGQCRAPQSPMESGAHRGGGPSLQGLQQEGLEPAQSPERTCMWAGGSGVLGRGWFGGSTDSPRAMLSSPLWERMSHLETSQLPAWVAVGGRCGCPRPSHFPGVSQTPAWTSGWLDPSCPPHSGVQSGPQFSPPRGRQLVGYPRPQPRGPHDSPSLTPELQGGPARDDLLRAPRKGPPGLSSHGVTG